MAKQKFHFNIRDYRLPTRKLTSEEEAEIDARWEAIQPSLVRNPADEEESELRRQLQHNKEVLDRVKAATRRRGPLQFRKLTLEEEAEIDARWEAIPWTFDKSSGTERENSRKKSQLHPAAYLIIMIIVGLVVVSMPSGSSILRYLHFPW